MKEIEVIKNGMKVVYRGSWGNDAPKETTIVGIELCKDGEKYGEIVEEVPADAINKCVFDLADGHWAYGWQIEKVLG